MDVASLGEVVEVVGEEVAAREADHLIAGVVPTAVEQAGVKLVDEAHGEGTVRNISS